MLPESIMWLGFTFENKIYFDVTLSMGSSSAAYCCQRVTSTVTYLYQQEGYDNVNYLDDLGAAEIEQEANTVFKVLGLLLREIGIRVNSQGRPPSFILTFLGILINSPEMTLEIGGKN